MDQSQMQKIRKGYVTLAILAPSTTVVWMLLYIVAAITHSGLFRLLDLIVVIIGFLAVIAILIPIRRKTRKLLKQEAARIEQEQQTSR